MQNLPHHVILVYLVVCSGAGSLQPQCGLELNDPPDSSSQGLELQDVLYHARFSFLRFLLDTNGETTETRRSRPAAAVDSGTEETVLVATAQAVKYPNPAPERRGPAPLGC